GALREYHVDDGWRNRFLELARGSRCIIVDVGSSDNLQWELQQIRQENLGHRVYLFTPPTLVRNRNRFVAWWKTVLDRAAGRKQIQTGRATTAASLGRAGLVCQSEDPGPGSVLTFNQAGSSLMVTSEATTPGEFIRPIADWVKDGRRTGRWRPATCAACGGVA